MQALGMIEVIGLPPAIEAADSALKAANVTLLAIAKADAGILTVEITGDVGAVTAAVDAGAAAAGRVGTLRAKHVIPHVDESLAGKMLMKGTTLFQPKTKPIKSVDNSMDASFTNSQADGAMKVKEVSDTSIFSIDSSKNVDRVQTEETNNREENTLKIESSSKEVDASKEIDASDEVTSSTKDSNILRNDTANIVSPNDINIGRDDIFGESTIDSIKDENQIYTVTDLKKKSNDTLRAILQSQGVELTEIHKSAKKQELIQLIIAQQNRR